MPRDLSNCTDEELGLAAPDDVEAFVELLRRYQSPLITFLRRFTNRLADAEDLLQETVLRLYASRSQYLARWRYRTWAFTIARRAAIDLHRQHCRERNALDEAQRSARSASEGTAETALNASDVFEVARRVLTREQSDALWLYHAEQMPPREIARILDRSWVSVKTMLHRARRQVRSEMETRSDVSLVSLRGDLR
jgi:RNA polymerase sigma-70 factor (ECF subfamily)